MQSINILAWIVALFVAVAMAACGDSKPRPAAKLAASAAQATAESAPLVVQMIKSFADYQKAKYEAWKEYESQKFGAWRTYEAAKSAAWSVYWEFQKEALYAFRAADEANYLKWLDAEKMGEYRRQVQLETESPALVQYLAQTGVKHDEFERVNGEAHKAYEQATAAAYKRYEVAEQQAYAAYLRAKLETLPAASAPGS